MRKETAFEVGSVLLRHKGRGVEVVQSASVLSVMAQAWLAYKFKFKSSQ